MADVKDIRRVALVGGGVIGSGWAARCLAHGLDVVATDPAPGAEAKIRAGIANAWPALTELGLKPGADQKRFTFAKDLEQAVADADFIQESAPENDELKRKLHARIDAAAKPATVIASSSSGLLPTNFQADCKHPERVLVGHPFNPEQHQAMSMIDAPGQAANTVVQVMQKGYVLNDRLLRPALVAIAKPPGA